MPFCTTTMKTVSSSVLRSAPKDWSSVKRRLKLSSPTKLAAADAAPVRERVDRAREARVEHDDGVDEQGGQREPERRLARRL